MPRPDTCWLLGCDSPAASLQGGDFRAGEAQGFYTEEELGTSLKTGKFLFYFIFIKNLFFLIFIFINNLLRLFQIHKMVRIYRGC